MEMQAIGKHVPSCKYVGIDLETTGLDEQNGIILEYAVVALDKNLHEIARIEGVTPLVGIPENVNKYVHKMHCENGLWNECINRFRAGDTDDVPEDIITKFIQAQLLDQDKNGKDIKPTILGSSIGFDVRWLKQHWPAVLDCLHYRQVDVSTCYELRGKSVDETAYTWPHGEKHRAMWDIQRSIFLAKAYKELLCSDL